MRLIDADVLISDIKNAKFPSDVTLKEMEIVGVFIDAMVDCVDSQPTIPQDYESVCPACAGSCWYDSSDENENPIECAACSGTGKQEE